MQTFHCWPLPLPTKSVVCCSYQLGTHGIAQIMKTASSNNQISVRNCDKVCRYDLFKKFLARKKRTREEKNNQKHELNAWGKQGCFN